MTDNASSTVEMFCRICAKPVLVPRHVWEKNNDVVKRLQLVGDFGITCDECEPGYEENSNGDQIL